MKEICYDNYYWQDELVRLRAMTPEDWESSYVNRFDSHARLLLQYEVELPPVPEKEQQGTQRFVGFNPESGRLMFTIETLDGVPVGGINLNSIDERNGTFSIGMQISVGQRAKGYGTAAMRLVLSYAFYERRLNKYEGSILDGNIGSMTMLKKLGAVEEGVRRQSIYAHGKYMDVILFGLTKDEFTENQRLLAK